MNLLKPGFRAVDVGANIGYYVLLIRKAIGQTGKIVAIEPSPENLPELYLNIKCNSLTASVEVIESAIGSHTGFVCLRGGINSGVVLNGEAAYRVGIDTLDNLIEGSVDFLKIDIEGFEGHALRGAMRLLSTRPILFVEVHPAAVEAHGSTAAELIDWLTSLYDHVSIFEQVHEDGVLRKVLNRYFGFGGLREVHAFERADFIEGSVTPFWVVCQSRSSQTGTCSEVVRSDEKAGALAGSVEHARSR
jgi:FkbM family methyltransferase